MKALIISSLLASSVLLSGCVISIGGDEDGYSSYNVGWEKREMQNREFISNLSTGVSKSAVVDELGAADFNELTSKNGDNIQILYYRTQRMEDDGVTTKNECTPLVFVNGSLSGFGSAEVAKYL
ncbi:DUF3192 domain-containing protein [Glaciecola sp. MH2013]|uniref:DUF3192 domain-containing protein n=1 Tax=Glaciecola sp. MH2013 TaxID=2785524 RepID=UPI00189EFC00|nr:DUF3192 domain-containing protein [Glaciecola sp. MH2013]MBF7072259.1 DUF3192 domain-containing protein [Glaciecola sp. MH2013]